MSSATLAQHLKPASAAMPRLQLPQAYLRLSPFRFMRDLALNWAAVFGLVALCAWLPHPAVWALSAIGVGVCQNAFGIFAHDALHYRIHTNRKVNDALARLFVTGPITYPLGSGRRNHLHHHTHVGTELDHDRHYHATRGKETPMAFLRFLLASLFMVNLAHIALKILRPQSASGATEGKTAPPADRRAFLMDVAVTLLTQGALWGSFTAITGQWWAYFVLWLLPLYTVSVFLNSVRSFCEHAMPIPDDEADATQRRITHTSSLLERLIVAPLWMNYHAEHHLFTGVPYYHLPAVHRWLKAQQAPGIQYRRSYLGTMTRYIRVIAACPPGETAR